MLTTITLLSLTVSILSIILLRPLAILFNLLDFPNNRKTHVGNIPLIGGISIFIAVFISHSILVDYDFFVSSLLFASFIILIQGVWDDLKNLKAKTKIFFQVLIAIILIDITDVKINSFGDLFGTSHYIELGLFSIPITVIAVVGLTNAINMIDGLDGLAISIVMIAIIGLLGFEIIPELTPFNGLLIVIISASFPFLLFNLTPNSKMKIFLGDGGSLFLGFIVSFALIYRAENNINFNPSFALWCVTIPLFDFFTVISIRFFENRSLVIASQDHIHDILKNQGFSNIKILLILVLSGLFFLFIGKFIENNFPAVSFSFFILLFLFYLLLRLFYIKKKT